VIDTANQKTVGCGGECAQGFDSGLRLRALAQNDRHYRSIFVAMICFVAMT